MSVSPVFLPMQRAHPPGGVWRRVFTLVLMLMVVSSSLVLGMSPAQAGSHGVGYWSGGAFLGAYNTDVDGRQAYCIDLSAASPMAQTFGPDTVTSLDALSRQELAELNYVLARWGQSHDPAITAAVALYTWSVADAGTYASIGGENYLVNRAPVGERATVLANLAVMRHDASVNAVTDPSLSMTVSMSDQYTGTVNVSAYPASLQGTATLTNAVFTQGGTSRTIGVGHHAITGTPAEGAASYQVEATMSVDAAGYGAAVDLYTTPGAQRLIAAVAGSSTGLSAHATSPVIPPDFQPEITTQVVSKFVQAGNQLTDRLTVKVTKGTWIIVNGRPAPVVAEGTLYGPLDEQPTEAATPPAGAPVAGTVTQTLTGAGTVTSPGVTAPASGFYTWVWQIDKTKQGGNSKYLTDSFTDRYGRVAETAVVPFQPEAVSKANGRLVAPGDAVTDTITVSSTNGMWLKQNGAPIPVAFEGTAYQVPGTLPPTEGGQVPADATPLGTVTVTATGPGTYTSPEVALPSGGFVTWVWQVRKSAQPEWVRPFLASDWTDRYGISVETHSVRWPITVTSQVREYNVHEDGRAFDKITVTGFPDNHGDFTGDGYWGPDTKTLTHTVYGPFTTDTELTNDLDLTTAPVVTRIETPAKNGVYDIGYRDTDRIAPTGPGYYVIVSTFTGDDRVQPYASSPGDIWERFFVPSKKQPVSVITQATPAALVGEQFEDTALVQGTTIPVGAYLVFRAHGPHASDVAPVCEEPFFTSKQVPVTQAGIYRSGTTSVETTGHVYWVETLYDRDGKILSEGTCGAPGETTVVTGQPEDVRVSTKAVETVQLGRPAHDVATVTGQPPSGATLTFEAYRQDGVQPVCTSETRVFATDPVNVDGPGEIVSADVVFETVGTYYWIETLRDRGGAVIHRGVCGAPNETTTVTAVPAPPVDALAVTGMGGWGLPLGIGAGLAVLAGAFTLGLGRRFAARHGHDGYEEDQDLLDLITGEGQEE